MSANAELIRQFERMAAVLEILGESRFRVLAYERAARVLDELTHDVAELAKDRDQLVAIDGIGKALADKIIEHVKTGRVADIEKALARVPERLPELLDISGLGPKTVALLWRDAGVTSLDDLQSALESGELEALPRMGKKRLENIQKSMAFARSRAAKRVKYGVALRTAEMVVETLRTVDGAVTVDFAGSLRRGRETIGDVDILVSCQDPERDGPALREALHALPAVEEVLLAGATKSSVRVVGGLQVDLRIVPADRYGAALLYFTGSKAHNVSLREWALTQKLHLNEYGLWKAEDFRDGQTDAKPVAAETEAAIYRALGLDAIPPELREDRGEFEAARAHNLPSVVERSDIRSDLHTHTTASDGSSSIEQLAEAAKVRGYHTVAITDHSPAQAASNGLDVDRLLAHAAEIRRLNERMDGIDILAGTEVDILPDGRLDYPDEVLAQLDVVVASPHLALDQDSGPATDRIIRAIENPYVHVIGHPTGRRIGERPGLPLEMARVIEAAVAGGTALEINACHSRVDLNDTLARAAAAAGALLAINTDAHDLEGLDHMRLGVLTARRAWITADQVINCLSAPQLKAWLHKKKKRSGR